MDKDSTPSAELTDTASVVASMLKEDTGRHMLDSGGAYGRNFERNQTRDFTKEPECFLKYDPDSKYDAWNYGMSTYHFLCANLTFDPVMDKAFAEFTEREDQADKGWFENMEAWADTFVPEKDDYRFTVNTYNHESLLDQTLQYIQFQNPQDDETYVILQVHGGCDVRGGYSKPRVFRLSSDAGMMDDSTMYLRCDGAGTDQPMLDGKVRECGATWTIDSGRIHSDCSPQADMPERPAVHDNGDIVCPECGKGHVYISTPF